MKKIDYKKITLEQLAAIVSKKMQEHGIDSILVGGGCVSIYSHNRYQSYDLDYVTYENMRKVERALKEINFIKSGKHFEHQECEYYIEFVSPPVAIGNEPIQEYKYHKTPLGTIKMLTPTDSVKDRLASFYHWDDLQGLEQAINICQEISNEVDIAKIKSWSEKEGQKTKYQIFLKRLKEISNQKF